ncbi:CYTH domain-containing protein [Candidatus Microgenomates bacterium]|nr:CYTH domain-containing protein [Candidatus Microgenomates bacterium]
MANNSSYREIEAKILDINLDEVKNKLRELNAVCEREIDLEQVVWWIRDKTTSLRVRKSSDSKIRLTMKEKVKDGWGYNEWETDISEYEKTIAIIDNLIPEPELRMAFSHHREDWLLDGVGICLDTIPKINPFLEIEAESEERVKEIATKLGLNPNDLIDQGMMQIILERLNLKPGRITL